MGARYQPGLGEQLVNVPQDLDLAKFDRMFIDLMTRPTPRRSFCCRRKVKITRTRDFICQ